MTTQINQENLVSDEIVQKKSVSENVQNKPVNAFTLIRQDNGIAHLVMNVIGATMNTLQEEFPDQINAMLSEIKNDTSIKGVVLLSGKTDSFVAGADITMLAACKTAAQATTVSQQGQIIFDQLENMNIPMVAAINGACLGGGLELAMACHARVCSDNTKTVLGLPEVQLGLLPGGGGTQRLPRLVGLQKALDMMLTGKQLRAKQALKAGLVDDVVPNSILIKTAEQLALLGKINQKKRRLSLQDKLLEGNTIGRKIVYEQAKKSVLAKTKGNYPAPLKIIDCVRTGIEQSSAQGFQVEAEHFGDLVMSVESKQLRQLFFATTDMKKEQGIAGIKAKRINKVGVLGGGLMGGGIAFVSATKAKLPVRIKDINHQGISRAIKTSYDVLNKKVKRGFMSRGEMQKQLANITGTIDFSGFHHIDMVVEAVFEELILKQKMLVEVEQNCADHTIFASNTSSLSIAKIAANAKRPENVIGLHYFSPVDKMPLVEIIAHEKSDTEKTSDQTISTTVAFAKKQGKTPIVVKDKAGFYVNRILAPYLNEAANLLLAGESIEKIDNALVQFGFPVGPMQLLDEVGIDVGAKIAPILQAELGARFTPPAVFTQLINDGRLGKKVQKGFYLYKKNSRKGFFQSLFKTHRKQADESVYQLLNVTIKEKVVASEIAERCVYLMLNEAMRCLEEGIIRNARDGDIGAIFGIGFPPFLGGPFRYIDKVGADKVITKLDQWASEHGSRFKPCSALVAMVEKKTQCYS